MLQKKDVYGCISLCSKVQVKIIWELCYHTTCVSYPPYIEKKYIRHLKLCSTPYNVQHKLIPNIVFVLLCIQIQC